MKFEVKENKLKKTRTPAGFVMKEEAPYKFSVVDEEGMVICYIPDYYINNEEIAGAIADGLGYVNYYHEFKLEL